MGQLMNDIISTADDFTSNFSDKGTFDYSIESLVFIDNLLEELSDYEWTKTSFTTLQPCLDVIFLKQPEEIMAESTIG